MITIINATNRPENKTRVVVEAYAKLVHEAGLEAQIFDMAELPADFIFNASYGKRSQAMETIIQTRLDPAAKLVVIAPEYNGSYPGVFKAFIDAIHPKHFYGKKAALVGVASGRAGNLRGMDHLTDVLHHLGVEVLSYKVPISRLDTLMQGKAELTDEDTLNALKRQIRRLASF
jgi:NAD(P)H-dependent FMN reductase